MDKNEFCTYMRNQLTEIKAYIQERCGDGRNDQNLQHKLACEWIEKHAKDYRCRWNK